jgi:hypothetical protein
MSDINSKIKQYEDKFEELGMTFQDRAFLQTGITVSRILDILENLGELIHLVCYPHSTHDSASDVDLSGMQYAEGARFDRGNGCLPGTREDIIGQNHPIDQ